MKMYIAFALVICFTWLATAWGWAIASGNITFGGDPYKRHMIVSTDRYMREVWGISGLQKLSWDRPLYSATPVFVLLQSKRTEPIHGKLVDYAHLVIVADERVFELYIPYERVRWEVSATPDATVGLTWRGVMPVMLTRTDYSFGKFMTFRQPGTWKVDPAASRHVTADRLSTPNLVAQATISIPADSAWQQLKELKLVG